METGVNRPTVKPDPNFDSQKDCEALRRAMKGLGTNEDALISVLCHRSWQQRKEIAATYQRLYGKDLEKDLVSDTSFNFRKILVRLVKDPVELAAFELHEAVKGAGTDEECLVEIICTKTNQELRDIELKYKELYEHELATDVRGDTSGYFRRLLVSLLRCNRPDDSVPNLKAADADAKALYEAAEKKQGSVETRFTYVLTSRSYSQLRLIFDRYTMAYRREIEDVIKSEFSGDMADALLAVVGAVRSRPRFFASRLRKAIEGVGTNDRQLLRIIVARCEIDLEEIMEEYQQISGTELAADVRNDTSGDYRKALLSLLGVIP